MVDNTHGIAPPHPIATLVTNNASGGGTWWRVYPLAGLGGVITLGGLTYLVYASAHVRTPHPPVGAH